MVRGNDGGGGGLQVASSVCVCLHGYCINQFPHQFPPSRSWHLIMCSKISLCWKCTAACCLETTLSRSRQDFAEGGVCLAGVSMGSAAQAAQRAWV